MDIILCVAVESFLFSPLQFQEEKDLLYHMHKTFVFTSNINGGGVSSLR